MVWVLITLVHLTLMKPPVIVLLQITLLQMGKLID